MYDSQWVQSCLIQLGDTRKHKSEWARTHVTVLRFRTVAWKGVIGSARKSCQLLTWRSDRDEKGGGGMRKTQRSQQASDFHYTKISSKSLSVPVPGDQHTPVVLCVSVKWASVAVSKRSHFLTVQEKGWRKCVSLRFAGILKVAKRLCGVVCLCMCVIETATMSLSSQYWMYSSDNSKKIIY